MPDNTEVKYKPEKIPLEKRQFQDVYRRTIWIKEQFEKYQQYWQPDLERYVMNARMLWGLTFGQWPATVVQRLLDQGRRPPTFNVLLDKAETFIGSVIGNGWEPRYSPAQGQLDSLTLKLQDMYYSDKALMEWDKYELECLLDSSCGVGYESLFVSDKYHDFGNIGFVKRNPRRILLNPGWHDSDVDHLHDYFTWTRLLVDEIMEIFDVATPRLKELRDKEKMTGINYGDNIGITDYKTLDQKWGDRHQVIELHWIERKKREWEYDKKNHCAFPDAGFPFHSKQDIQAKMKYIQMMGLGQEDITYVKQNKVTKYVQAVCPTLDPELFLINGKDKIQCGNCNLFPLGLKLEGQYQGMVDREADLQRAINKGEMNIEDQQLRSAKGAFLLDKALSGGDANLEEQIESSWNDTGARIWVSEGSTADLGQHGGVIELSPSNVTNDMFTQQERRYRLMDRLSKVPAAMESRQESAREANKMFENKIAIGQIGQRFYSELYKTHKKEKAMAYATQARITYAGAVREFADQGGKDSFTINRMETNEKGNTEVLDDIASLPDMKVSMIPAKDGINIRMQLREDFSGILQAVQNDPNNRLLVLTCVDGVMDSIPLPEDKKDELEKDLYLLKMDAALQVVGRIAQARQALGVQPGQQTPQQLPAPGQASPEQIAGAVQERAQGQQPITGGQPQEQVPQQRSERRPTEQELRQGTPQQPAKAA